MKSVVLLALVATVALGGPGDDCVVYGEKACKDTTRCSWQSG
jgi:hypothetical protein